MDIKAKAKELCDWIEKDCTAAGKNANERNHAIRLTIIETYLGSFYKEAGKEGVECAVEMIDALGMNAGKGQLKKIF